MSVSDWIQFDSCWNQPNPLPDKQHVPAIDFDQADAGSDPERDHTRFHFPFHLRLPGGCPPWRVAHACCFPPAKNLREGEFHIKVFSQTRGLLATPTTMPSDACTRKRNKTIFNSSDLHFHPTRCVLGLKFLEKCWPIRRMGCSWHRIAEVPNLLVFNSKENTYLGKRSIMRSTRRNAYPSKLALCRLNSARMEISGFQA
jgi:hypothetical protein